VCSGVWAVLRRLGVVALERGDHTLARARLAESLAIARDAQAAVWAEGQTKTLEQAIACAVEEPAPA
jgi:hypothetical protein